MILPTKYIPLSGSLLGAGMNLLQHFTEPSTPIAIWDRVKNIPEIGTYNRFVLTLDFLYVIGAIDIVDGLIVKKETS